MLIQEKDIDTIRANINIVDLISEYLTLKKIGNNYKGLCPFHIEKTPSFTVSSEKQIFKCFGCGVSGNVYSFLMKKESLSFPESVEECAKRIGYKLKTVKGVAKDIDKHLAL